MSAQSSSAARTTPLQHSSPAALTAAFYAAFVGLGFVVALSGPTLSGLAANTGASISAISSIFVANSVGRMLGSQLCGRLLDRVPGMPVMASGFAMLALLFVVVPFIQSLPLLIAVFVLVGIGQNFVDVSGNTLIVWTHGAKVGPYMNALHFTFGVGAFVTPLIAAAATAATGNIRLVYFIVAALMLPLIVWMLRLHSPARTASASQLADAEVNWRLVALVALFFFLVVGIEVVLSNWTFTFGVAIGLGAEVGAAALASGYWGAYSLARLIAIPVSMRVRADRMLFVDMAGLIVSAIVLLIGQKVQVLAWAGIVGIGLSTASVFPTMLTYVGQRVNVTGKINAMLFTASTLGAMFFPWLIGQLFEPVGSQSLPALVLLNSMVALAVFALANKESSAKSPEPRIKIDD